VGAPLTEIVLLWLHLGTLGLVSLFMVNPLQRESSLLTERESSL
jgi:hypothetical protein